MDEFQELLIVLCQALNIVQRLVTACEDVASVDADAQPWVLNLKDELDEGLIGRQRLRTLARRCLQQDRALGRGELQSTLEIRLHVRQGHRKVATGGLAHVNDYALGSNGATILEILDEKIRMVVILCTRLLTQIDDVLAVNEEVQLGLLNGVGREREFLIRDVHLGILRAAQEDLNRLLTRRPGREVNRVDERLLLPDVGTDEVEFANQRTREDVRLLVCVALLGRRVEQVAELRPRSPGG